MHEGPYFYIILGSGLVIIAYLFNILAKKIQIPGVLLLLALGIGSQIVGKAFHWSDVNWYPILRILGIIGIILIVLEAALDLKLRRGEYAIIWRSILLSLLLLVSNAILIAWIFQMFFTNIDYVIALIYALPFSIVSSAIVISSILHLDLVQRDFMIFESTFSDIFGIMWFYFLIGNMDAESATQMGITFTSEIAIILVASIVLSYLLVIGLQRLRTNLKLFLLIAVLLLIYSTGKLMHKSPLLLILFFGLTLSNTDFFFRGRLQKFIDRRKIARLRYDFRLFTLESAFVVRSFFFFIFGAYVNLDGLLNLDVILISLSILAVVFGTRMLTFKAISGSKSHQPGNLIAPRGLVSILLFFSIPMELKIPEFESGIMLFVILASNVVLAYALMVFHRRKGVHSGSGDMINRPEISEIELNKQGQPIKEPEEASI